MLIPRSISLCQAEFMLSAKAYRWVSTWLKEKEEEEEVEEKDILITLLTLNRPYFLRPRKYRRLFSEPTYWPRRSRGQYGVENNQACIFEAKGNKSLIPGGLARSPPSLYSKSTKQKLCVCAKRTLASAVLVQVVSGGHRNGFIECFSSCIRQLADSPGE